MSGYIFFNLSFTMGIVLGWIKKLTQHFLQACVLIPLPKSPKVKSKLEMSEFGTGLSHPPPHHLIEGLSGIKWLDRSPMYLW